MISIIIPAYNEEYCLSRQSSYFRQLARHSELIFVDGGSTDLTVPLAKEFSKCLSTEKSRSAQMNFGARSATGDILLFLHADSQIPLGALMAISHAVKEQGICGGCLTQVLNAPGPLYRWIAWTGNLRARISRIYFGDQGIFVTKEAFDKLGGFPPVKLGEDILFTKKMRAYGKVRILPEHIRCSIRRWKTQGILKTFWINMRVYFQLMTGRNLDQMANEYKDIRG